MKRILFCASTVSHLRRFHLPYLQAFQEAGWEVWAASDTGESLPYADRTAILPVVKRFFSPQNLKAVGAARRLLQDGRFDAVSVHTTLAAAVIRAAALTLSKRPILFYTCHGYLFAETDGAAKRLAYLLPEKLCARVTDVLMVMNEEDRRIAVKHRLSSDGIVHSIPGMGVDFSRYSPLSPEQRASLRAQYGYAPEHVVFVYAAEFSARKNHALLLHAFAKMARECPNARLFLAGNGALREECVRLAGELNVSDRVYFAGELNGMGPIYGMCDAAVSSSRSEGLPFNVMEAMAAGVPVAATRVKGHVDLIRPGENGLLFAPDSLEEAAAAMAQLCRSPNLRAKLSASAAADLDRYALPNVLLQVLAIYRKRFPHDLSSFSKP